MASEQIRIQLRAVHTRLAAAVVASAMLLPTAGSVHASGEPRWVPGMPGVNTWFGIEDMVVFDDGTGPALYICGFLNDGPIQRWKGETWEPVGPAAGGHVMTLHVFDGDAGPTLYAAGLEFTIDGKSWKLAKFDGTNWTGIDSYNEVIHIWDLEMFDDGSGKGPELYATGLGWCQRVSDDWKCAVAAKWTETGWEPLWDGVQADPFSFEEPGGRDLQVFDDGQGARLYVAGDFQSLTNTDPAFRTLVRWNGRWWEPIGNGPLIYLAYDMTVFDPDENGPVPALLVACGFDPDVQAWDGVEWKAFGSIPGMWMGGYLYESEVLTIGTQKELVIAGNLGTDHYYGDMRRWDGKDWAPLHYGWGVIAETTWGPWALASFDDGSTHGPALFVGGKFIDAGMYPAQNIARWGVPIKPICPGDMFPSGGDARINIDDLLEVIGHWGTCAEPCIPDCLADIDANCEVDIDDLLEVIGHWGPCPGSIWP